MYNISMKSKKMLIFLVLVLSLIILSAYFLFAKCNQDSPNMQNAKINMQQQIDNENLSFDASPFGSNKPYEADFIKINSISFAVQDENLFVRYSLNGVLPKKNELPSYDGDKITGAIFYMTLDDNYFDGYGNKNPGGAEAELKMSFYGDDEASSDMNKISVNGELVDGGIGYNYFVAKYKYRELLLNQSGDQIVFTANSVALSSAYRAGASANIFQNSKKMALTDPREMLIELKPER